MSWRRRGGGGPGGALGVDWLEVAGHSLAAAGGARVLPEGGYAFRLGAAIGARRFREYAIGGAIACWPNAFGTGDGGYGHVLQNALRPGSPGLAAAGAPYVPKSQVVVAHFGLNDLGELGAQKPLPFQTGLRTILSRLCAAAVWEEDATAWAFTGAWAVMGVSAAAASNSGPAVKYSTVVNDKATFTLPADYPGGLVVGVGLWINATWPTLTYGVKVDGQARPDVVINPQQFCDQNLANKHLVHTLRLGTGRQGDPALTAGAHSVEMTLKSGTALGIDFAQVEADPLDGPVLLMPLPNKPASYALWTTWAHGPNAATDPINDAAVDSWKAAQRAVQAEFPGRVVELDLDAIGLVRSSGVGGDFVADGAHFNEGGHGKIAVAARDALVASGRITDRVRSRPAVVSRPVFRQVGVSNGAGAFATGWSNYGSGLAPLMWRKDEFGKVRVRGACKAAAGQNGTILPAGTLPKPAFHVDKTMTQFDGTATWVVRPVRVQSDGLLSSVGSPTISTAAGNLYLIDFEYDAEVG